MKRGDWRKEVRAGEEISLGKEQQKAGVTGKRGGLRTRRRAIRRCGLMIYDDMAFAGTGRKDTESVRLARLLL